MLKDDEALIGLVVGLGFLALAAAAALAFLLLRRPLCAHCNTRHRPGRQYCSAQKQPQVGGYQPGGGAGAGGGGGYGRTGTGMPIDLSEN
jgi:hypothetical protein